MSPPPIPAIIRWWLKKLKDFIKHAFRKGLLLLGCGEYSIRFCPSLRVKTKEIDKCLCIFDEVAREVAV